MLDRTFHEELRGESAENQKNNYKPMKERRPHGLNGYQFTGSKSIRCVLIFNQIELTTKLVACRVLERLIHYSRILE